VSPNLPPPSLPSDVVVLCSGDALATRVSNAYRAWGARIVTTVEPRSADVAVTTTGDATLDEAVRALRPGGSLVVLDDGGESGNYIPSDEVVLAELRLHFVPVEVLE
jgi:threonine dehydrogenase-like Zn-dependent dehydrogenase